MWRCYRQGSSNSASIAARPGRALEGDVAGQGEGRRHWCVTGVGGGPDPRYVLRCEQARTRGKHVVNIAMAAMCRHHSEVRDDGVVTVVRGDHKPDRFSVR
jgi:hypothetical protein